MKKVKRAVSFFLFCRQFRLLTQNTSNSPASAFNSVPLSATSISTAISSSAIVANFITFTAFSIFVTPLSKFPSYPIHRLLPWPPPIYISALLYCLHFHVSRIFTTSIIFTTPLHPNNPPPLAFFSHLFLVACYATPHPAFWAVAPKGTMSWRTQGVFWLFVCPSVRLCMHPTHLKAQIPALRLKS